MPRLDTLDDIPTNRNDKSSASSVSNEAMMLFQQDWSLIEECIGAGMAPPEEKLACNQGNRLFLFPNELAQNLFQL